MFYVFKVMYCVYTSASTRGVNTSPSTFYLLLPSKVQVQCTRVQCIFYLPRPMCTGTTCYHYHYTTTTIPLPLATTTTWPLVSWDSPYHWVPRRRQIPHQSYNPRLQSLRATWFLLCVLFWQQCWLCRNQ